MRFLPVLCSMAGMAVAGAALAALPPAPSYRQIKEWVIACDNTRACFAKYLPDNSGLGGYLSIWREAGPGGKLVVSVQGDENSSQPAPTPEGLRLDGKPLATRYPWRSDGEGVLRLEGADAAAFLRALRDGGRLDVIVGEKAGVSLSGLSAVLLAMDETQGRLGNRSALARSGVGAVSAVPPAPPIPLIRPAPVPPPLKDMHAFAARVRAAQGAVLKAHECEAKEDLVEEDVAQPLNAGEAIVLLGCLQGAYRAANWCSGFRVARRRRRSC